MSHKNTLDLFGIADNVEINKNNYFYLLTN